jgi:hypothetical protein
MTLSQMAKVMSALVICMVSIANVADWETGIIGCNGVEIVGTVGKGFDRTKGVMKGSMIHSTAKLAILLRLSK